MCKSLRCLTAILCSVLLAVFPCLAQSAVPSSSPLSIPAGTRLNVVLAGQISSGDTHVGDSLHAQIVSPIVVGSQVAIPSGTFLDGKIVNISQRNDQLALSLSESQLVFPNGYVAQVPGTVVAHSAEGWWRPDPGNSHRAAVLIPLLAAPVVGAGIGAAVAPHEPGPNNVNNAARDTGIGLAVGVAVMTVGLVAYHMHRTKSAALDFFFAAGAPMDIGLPFPVSIDAAQAAQASSMPQPPLVPPAQMPSAQPAVQPDSICHLPDTPGTPDTIIPGTPATPDSPGTPDIVIPGTPPTPGAVVPCP